MEASYTIHIPMQVAELVRGFALGWWERSRVRPQAMTKSTIQMLASNLR